MPEPLSEDDRRARILDQWALRCPRPFLAFSLSVKALDYRASREPIDLGIAVLGDALRFAGIVLDDVASGSSTLTPVTFSPIVILLLPSTA